MIRDDDMNTQTRLTPPLSVFSIGKVRNALEMNRECKPKQSGKTSRVRGPQG